MTIPCGSAPNRCTTPPGSKRWRAASRLGRSFESAPPEAAGKFGLSSGEFPGRHDGKAGMGDARRGRRPLGLVAGKAPWTVRGELPGSGGNYLHFIQEPFDQSGIVRPYAKRGSTLPPGVMTKETRRRAHTVAHSAPMGPVYLM